MLLRSDHNAAFTSPIRDALTRVGLQAATAEAANPLDQPNGRALLAFLRITANREDHLAWRTLFNVWCRGVGDGAIASLYDVARRRGESFAPTVLAVSQDPELLPNIHRHRIGTAITNVLDLLGSFFPNGPDEYDTCEALMEAIRRAAETVIPDSVERDIIILELTRLSEAAGATSIKDLVHAIGVASEDIEQEIEQGKINILTMHKAKGLTAEAIIIVATEDEYLPGRATGEEIDDERRLLYVSLTRAKHHLFITYCDQRTGRQRHTGRSEGRTARSLTRFLRDGPLTPVDGITFINAPTEEQ